MILINLCERKLLTCLDIQARMEEENSDAMNLNLDLGPSSELETLDIQALLEENNSGAMNLDLVLGPCSELTTGSITNEVFQGTNEASRLRAQPRGRHPLTPQPEAGQDYFPDPPEPHNISRDCALQVGEGSVVVETTKKKDVVEKGTDSYGKFFECSICLDMAKDPVVTSCGHLFCWRCLFQWFHVHSNSNECPNCKGVVILRNVTPIYGPRNDADVIEQEGSNLEILPRPQARRVNSLSQTLERNTVPTPIEEMLQRGANINGLTQDLVQLHEPENAHHEQAEIDTPLLSSFLPPQEDPPLFDDLDSFLSDIMNSGSDLNIDVEMNSMESLTAASSRRRNNSTSEVPNVNDEDYQAPRPDV